MIIRNDVRSGALVVKVRRSWLLPLSAAAAATQRKERSELWRLAGLQAAPASVRSGPRRGRVPQPCVFLKQRLSVSYRTSLCGGGFRSPVAVSMIGAATRTGAAGDSAAAAGQHGVARSWLAPIAISVGYSARRPGWFAQYADFGRPTAASTMPRCQSGPPDIRSRRCSRQQPDLNTPGSAEVRASSSVRSSARLATSLCRSLLPGYHG